ncbi:MAG: hypothetical protein GY788_24825, partial [bacterium]|nr:hypothetical protein [bacterium]
NTHTYTPSGQLHTTSDGTDAHHAITDQHSDLVAGVDLVTTATDLTLAYTPWGQPTETTGTPTSTLGYQSDHISPSGLINMNGRWYDPTTGTFTSRDAIDDPALANRFGYTPANPLSYNDLSGNAAAAAAGVAGVCLLTAGIGCVVAAAAAVVGVSYAAAVAVGWLPAPSWPKINLCPWCDSGSPRAAARAAASQRAASARLTGAAAAYAAWRANNAWSDRLQSQVDAAGPAGGGAPPVPPPFPPFPPPVPICLTNVCWPASVTTGGGSSGSSGAIETLSLEQIFGDWFISWSGEDLSHLKPNLITEVGEITYGLLTGDLDPSLSGTAPDRLVESILVAVGITAAGQPGFNAQGCFSGTSSPVGLCNDYMEQIADLALSFRPGGECSKAIQSGASAEELIACAVEMAASAAGAATSRGSAGSATRSTSIADDLARAGCSFSGATLVLMADGSRKPIEDIEVGDKVLATDPEAGQTIAREVT